MILKVSTSISDSANRFWRFNLYGNDNNEWYGGFYYDFETKNMCGWSRYGGTNDCIEISLNDGSTIYVFPNEYYAQTAMVDTWWNNHKNDRDDILKKLIIETMI